MPGIRIDILISFRPVKKNEYMNKTLLKNETLGPLSFTGEFFQSFQEEM